MTLREIILQVGKAEGYRGRYRVKSKTIYADIHLGPFHDAMVLEDKGIFIPISICCNSTEYCFGFNGVYGSRRDAHMSLPIVHGNNILRVARWIVGVCSIGASEIIVAAGNGARYKGVVNGHVEYFEE